MVRDKSARAGARAAAAAAALCLLCIAAVVLGCFSPTGVFAGNAGECVLCEWSDGSATREDYAQAYAALTGISPDGTYLEFSRGGCSGRAETGEAFRTAYRILTQGSLAEILSLRFTDGTRVERAALYRAFSGRVWYSGAYFVWTGMRAERTDSPKADELELLDGELSSALRETGIKTLYVRGESEVKASALVGSSVEEIMAEKPYFFEDGALYRESSSGTVLVAALPSVRELTVRTDTVTAEEGALSACRRLRSLTLPFVGNTVFVDAADYCGDLGVLFGLSDEREYDVPETLVSVKVLGGRLRGFAFSGCSSLTEIDACGIPAFAVSRQAFLGCGSLQKIHTACADIVCPEGFVSERVACGCFVYCRTAGFDKRAVL